MVTPKKDKRQYCKHSGRGHHYPHGADSANYANPLDVLIDKVACRVNNVADVSGAIFWMKPDGNPAAHKHLEETGEMLLEEWKEFRKAWRAQHPELEPERDRFGFPEQIQPLRKSKKTGPGAKAATAGTKRPVRVKNPTQASSGMQTDLEVSRETQTETMQTDAEVSRETQTETRTPIETANTNKRRRLEEGPEGVKVEDDDIPYFDQELLDMTGKKGRYKRLAGDRLYVIHKMRKEMENLRKELDQANGRIEELEKEGLSD